MHDLVRELNRFEWHLREANRAVVADLLPGTSADRVLSVRSSAPSSIIEWFRWHDGVRVRDGQTQDDANVIPGYTLVSLDEAIRIIPIYDGDPDLGDHWLPLLQNGGGDLYAAVWMPGCEAGVFRVMVGEETEAEFASIAQMVVVFNACFTNGAYFVDAQGWFDISPMKYEEVLSQLA
jgi:hypothetical protein